MKRITLITQFFPPDYAATGQLLNRLTIKLSDYKLKFQIISGMPSYAFKNGANKLEFNNKRLILRTNLSTFFDRKIFGRLLNSILFSLNAIYNLIFILPKSDLLIFTTEPPFAPFISIVTRFFRDTKFIIIIYDSYPNILFENNILNKDNPIIKVWLFFNKIIFEKAEKIIMLSQPMGEKFILDYPNTKEKLQIIPSWADVNKIKPLNKRKNWFIEKHNLQEKFVILYSGNQGRCHDIQTILDTSLLLSEKQKYLFLFIGNGYQNQLIKEFKAKYNLKNIKILDYQSFEDLPFSLTSGDLALVSIAENAANLIAPSKFYGHLAAGTPIALISPANSYLEKLIKENNIGRAFRNCESKKLKEWITKLDKDKKLKATYSKNSRKFIIENFSEEIVTQRYFELINDIINIE